MHYIQYAVANMIQFISLYELTITFSTNYTALILRALVNGLLMVINADGVD